MKNARTSLFFLFVGLLAGCGAQNIDNGSDAGLDPSQESFLGKPTTDGKCGINSGRRTHEYCGADACCSDAGWCGTTAAYCSGTRVNASYDGPKSDPGNGNATNGNTVAGNGNTTAGSGLPAKVLVGYFPTWLPDLPRLASVPQAYNVILLFAATPVGGAPGTTGAVKFDGFANATVQKNLVADIATCRARGQKIILSIGGAGEQVQLNTRARSQAFVDSIRTIAKQLGGIDGVDLNTYEGATTSITEYTFIGQTLKTAAYFGPNFVITTPPAPWNTNDLAMSKALVAAGALDLAMPQYYDGPDLADPTYIKANVPKWVSAVGASHVVVLFGIEPGAANYTTTPVAVSTYNAINASTPTIRGAGLWQINNDKAQSYSFANSVKP